MICGPHLRCLMSKVQEVEKQIEADVRAGKLDSLTEQALHEHAAGESTEL